MARSGHYNWKRRAAFFALVEADRAARERDSEPVADESDDQDETEEAYLAATTEAAQMVADGVWR